MDKHLGAVIVTIRERAGAAPKVNEILTQYGGIVVARMGFPYEKRGVHIVTLIVEGTTDEIGSLTGKLGMLKSVTVKSTLAKL